MNISNSGIALLLISTVAGCGQPLVQFLDLSASNDLAAATEDLAVGDLARADLATSGDDGGQPTAPQVVATNPAGDATSICVPFAIDATFDRAMAALTIDAGTFLLAAPGPTTVTGAVDYDAATKQASFLPSSSLKGGTTYTATLTTGVHDIAGVGLAADKVWSFTTSASPCMQPVNLRSLATFVAVSGAGLTNTNSGGITVLNGDVGLSPTATCLGDGLPCSAIDPTINGTLYANDPAGKAAAAKADLVSAYDDAAGRPPGIIVTANLAGQHLAPGVYTSQPASSMDIAVGGILTLDGQGDPNGVWIFQIGSTLTVNTGASVVLVNQAQAANVFWAVGSASSMSANVSFNGTVLAQSSNSVELGSTVNGRLLCTTGQITLKSDTINLP